MEKNEKSLPNTDQSRPDRKPDEESFYYSSSDIRKKGMVFNFIIGGRGIGKTYNFIRHAVQEKIFHCYLRRTQTEIDLGCNRDINPYTVPCEDIGVEMEVEPSKNICYLKRKEGEEKKVLSGYCIALSTFSNVRGGDFSRVQEIIFDEFIPETSKRKTIKQEADAFFNLYESIARNREIQGKDPLKVFFLSNSVSIISDIILELNLVPFLEMMIRKGQRFCTIPERKICIEMPEMEIFTDSKKETALYALTKGTRFFEHAVENKFSYDSWYNVKKENLAEYRPLCGVLSIYFYAHKHNGKVYVTESRADCAYYSEDEIALFRRNHYFYLREVYISGKMYFSDMTVKEIARQLLK